MNVLVVGSLVWSGSTCTAAEPRPDALLQKYCYDCHAQGEKKGGVSFDEVSKLDGEKQTELWHKVLKNVRSGLMPPPGHERPTAAEQQTLAQWIVRSAFQSDPAHPDPGRVTLRRLNRTEYRNSLRDLLGVEFDVSTALPPDDIGYGFDNIGDVLSLSPMRMEKFVEAAIVAVGAGMPMDTVAISSQMALPADYRTADGSMTGDRMSFYQVNKVSKKYQARAAGTYRIHIAGKVDGQARPDPQRVRVHMLTDDKEFFSAEYKWSDAEYYDDERIVEWAAGEHDISFVTEPLLDLQPLPARMDYRILYVRVDGPLEREQWIHPPGYNRFYAREAPPQDPAERRVYAREVLGKLVKLAYRRPVSEQTLDQLVNLAESTYSTPGVPFESGIAQAVVAMLASPRFLFHLETADPLTPGEQFAQVDEYTLASRLSFTLWSSLPDEELLQLAEKRELRKNFDAQVKRMLDSPKSRAFVENFSGQWLQSRSVLDIPINSEEGMPAEPPRQVAAAEPVSPMPTGDAAGDAPQAGGGAGQPGRGAGQRAGGRGGNRGGRRAGPPPGTVLTPEIREAMKQEVESYFDYVLRGDRSVLEFLQSDYTFVNETLAPVYGIAGITGPQMRQVRLPEGDPRGGVLTMGSVLTVTSNPTRTSPVKRGKWILENILGTPPAPPPPNIPALEDSTSKLTDRVPTQRELLAIHRASPLCSSCHARMDPLGLALENFNLFGRYRTTENQQPIVAAGELGSGETFANISELKASLVKNHQSEFYRTLTEKLLVYATGRGMEYYDVATIDNIVTKLEQDNGKFSTLLSGILESAPFQRRRPQPHALSRETSLLTPVEGRSE